VLKAPDQERGFSLELFIGEIIVKVQKRLGSSPSFRLGTPSAVITVRGTRFLVRVNKKHKTYVNVFDGLVEVEGLMQGSPHIFIRPGFSSGVEQDRAPEEPRQANPGEGDARDGDAREGGRDGQNRGDRGHEDQQREQQKPQPKPVPPNQGSDGKPD
jgi:ferric-dicitrate binding protein FerR (iron transport regulator)